MSWILRALVGKLFEALGEEQIPLPAENMTMPDRLEILEKKFEQVSRQDDIMFLVEILLIHSHYQIQ